jgi:hypothetical protein
MSGAVIRRIRHKTIIWRYKPLITDRIVDADINRLRYLWYQVCKFKHIDVLIRRKIVATTLDKTK